MSTTVTMSPDEVKNTPLTQEELDVIRKVAAISTDPDSPPQTQEELAQFKPLREAKPKLYAQLHPASEKPEQNQAVITIDADILDWFKAQEKEYQAKINAVLRHCAFGP